MNEQINKVEIAIWTEKINGTGRFFFSFAQSRISFFLVRWCWKYNNGKQDRSYLTNEKENRQEEDGNNFQGNWGRYVGEWGGGEGGGVIGWGEWWKGQKGLFLND